MNRKHWLILFRALYRGGMLFLKDGVDTVVRMLADEEKNQAGRSRAAIRVENEGRDRSTR